MYKLMQKNSRKLLAIFAVMLMIVFILPTTFKNQMRGTEQTMLSRGKEKVTAAQINAGRGEWQMLKLSQHGRLHRARLQKREC